MKVSTFRADTRSIDKVTGEYRDPLMKWPLRGAAFTNEIGEAFRPLIGGYATLTWIPVLMYIGADVYDKYKNDETDYSPDSRRLLKQAIFQGLSSVLLPIAAVKIGQALFSEFGRLGQEKMSINKKEKISKIAEDFVANGQLKAYRKNDIECVNAFLDKVHNLLDFKKQQESAQNPFVKILHALEEKLFKHSNQKSEKYAQDTIKDLVEQSKKLVNPDKEFKTTKIYKDYADGISKGQTDSIAMRRSLIKYQQRKMLNGRYIKTLGGLIALGLAIKPIDSFVENVLIGKVIGPGIDKIEPKNKKIALDNID